MTVPLAETHALTLRAAGRVLVHRLDWRIHAGERWCIVGRNAVGKSTLLRALAGLPAARGEAASAGVQIDGDIQWLGRPQRDWAAADAAAVRAFMPQQTSDRFATTVQRLLDLSVVVAARREPSQVLRALDVHALAQRNVLQLSGGERQRVALAQCALQGAPLMLMDEPIAFQDPAHQLQVSQWLTGLSDAALVFSAHDVNWIARTATHVLALHADGVAQQGSVAQMFTAERLERAYGCAWREVRGVWVAD
jgi:iron complex transport system ATP-binding protein